MKDSLNSPPEITATRLEGLAADAVAARHSSTFENIVSTFLPIVREKRIQAEVAQWSELITALSARYPVVSEWITEHKNDIDPSADQSEPFFSGYEDIFQDRVNAIAAIISLGKTLKDKTIPAREVIDSIRNTTVEAENAISKSLIANVIIRMTNNQILNTPDQIRNVLAAAVLHSSEELHSYTSHGNPEYSTLKHTGKVVDFIVDATNIDDTSALTHLNTLYSQNTERINLYAQEKAKFERLAYESTLEQANSIGKSVKPELINEIVQDWSDFTAAASEAGEKGSKLIKENAIFELLFKGNLAETAEAMLRLPQQPIIIDFLQT